MFVHCGQTVGRIKMKCGMQVGLSSGHTVLDGTQLPLPKGTQPPIFGPYLLRPNGCMDQDVTWYGAKPRPRRLCVRWGPRFPSPKWGGAPPKFSAHVYWGQTAGWMKMVLDSHGGRLQPRQLCVRWGPSPPPKFSAHVYYSYCDFVRTLHSRYWFVQVLVFYAFYF